MSGFSDVCVSLGYAYTLTYINNFSKYFGKFLLTGFRFKDCLSLSERKVSLDAYDVFVWSSFACLVDKFIQSDTFLNQQLVGGSITFLKNLRMKNLSLEMIMMNLVMMQLTSVFGNSNSNKNLTPRELFYKFSKNR